MRDQTGRGASGGGDDAAITNELLALQQALDHLSQTEQHLIPQGTQLRAEIAYYDDYIQRAREADREDLAALAQNRRAQALPRLTVIQEQLKRIQARKAEIIQRREALLTQARFLADSPAAASATLYGPLPAGPLPPAAPEQANAQPVGPSQAGPALIGSSYVGAPPAHPPYPTSPAYGPGLSYTHPSYGPPNAYGGPGTPPWSPPPRQTKDRSKLWIGLSTLLVLLLTISLGMVRVLSLSRSPAPGVAIASPPVAPTATHYPPPKPQTHPFQPDGSGPNSSDCLRYLRHACYSPEQIHQAFGLNALYRPGYDGTGQTIVIIGAGHSSSIQSDLTHFDQTWGLPDPPNFQILQPHGPPANYTCPDDEDDLLFENTLDVEWAHAIAPGANITLLIWRNHGSGTSPEDNCGLYDIPGAVQYAVEHQLGQIVTISYGGSELGIAGETQRDQERDRQEYQWAHTIFQEAAQRGVTVLAAAGDDGATNPNGDPRTNGYWRTPNISWPASDPYVLAVGGTQLQIQDASGTYGSERVWNEADFGATGGGLSAVFPEPDYQKHLPNQGLFQGKRGIPDLSFPADNFVLYGSFFSGSLSHIKPQWRHWGIVGGTSISTPCWAGLIAIANQMHSGEPLGFLHPALYSLHGKGLHDITAGTNSFAGVQGYSAQHGYDLATGWGTPIANQLLPALLDAVDNAMYQCANGPRQCV